MDSAKKKILIADDDQHVIDTVGSVLKDAGFEVLTAFDGQEGLDTALKEKPDLLVLDIIMPKKSGLETLFELRQNSWGKNVPIIILTNVNDNEQLAKALELGVDEYMIKSNVHLSHIAERAKHILGI